MYVVDFDDLCDEFDPWEELHAIKARIPGFRCTLFAIPARCSDVLLSRYRALDWVELAVHGYHHSASECLVWGYDETVARLEELEALGWTKLFKAPNWQLSEGAYRALVDRGWKVADHATYAYRSGRLVVDRYTHNMPCAEGYHGHTWGTMGNGPSDWAIEERDDFAFVSEACQPLDWGFDGYPDEQDEHSSWSSKSAFGFASARTATGLLGKFVTDNDDVVVDFGGNDGYVPSQIRSAGFNVWSIELSPMRSQVSDRRYGINTICADLNQIPVKDDAFDWGYCSHTLEHVADLEKTWAELKRTCRKGVFFVCPVESQEQFDDNPAHVRRHSAQEWCDLLGAEMLDDRGLEVVGVWRR